MKTMISRRSFLCAVGIASASAVLTACGGSSSSTASSTASSAAASSEAASGESVELIVFAAASLTETLNAIAETYSAENPGVTFSFNFDSSGTLKTQIQEGADCDLFLSAGQKQMNQLDSTASAEGNTEGLDFVPYTRPTGTDTAEPLKIGVLISGSGTNLQALIDLIAAGKLNASIELVVSSRPSAKGLQRAERAGIQTLTLSKDVYADPIAADEIIAHELLERGCEYVVMAGYMRMVHTPLLAAFPNRVVNLHPALLPSFTGAHAIDDAFARGVKVTGVTVHFANEIYDNGPIIAQRALAVEEGWDVDTLEEHIHAIEHVLYPEVVQMLADGRVHVLESGKVAIDAPRG